MSNTIRVVGSFASVQDALVEGLELCTFRVRDASFDYEYWGCAGTQKAIDIDLREDWIDLEVIVPVPEEVDEEYWEATAGHDIEGCRVVVRAELMEGSEPTVEERNGFWAIAGTWRIEAVA